MNSLNILSTRVIGQTPPTSPSQPRQRSFSEGNLITEIPIIQPRRSASQHVKSGAVLDAPDGDRQSSDESGSGVNLEALGEESNEKTSLLRSSSKLAPDSPLGKDGINLVAKRLAGVLAETLRLILSTLAAPGVYAWSCFYNEQGIFSPLLPLRRLSRILPRRSGHKSISQATGHSDWPEHSEAPGSENQSGRRKSTSRSTRRKLQAKESFSSATSDSNLDTGLRGDSNDERSNGQTKSKAQLTADDPTMTRRSIRIKAYNKDTNRRRKERNTQENPSVDAGSAWIMDKKQPPLTAATLKSPTSPASSSLRMTKYPRALAPPQPLIPRRQPSYSSPPSRSSPRLAQKTLVIDLDETLIHSLAKGGRMSSGHMVEVKLNTNVGYGGTTLGPQHPILYYVHKRPHCDDFLRKVCKWYNLVVFTASVQEYADPVIDWLEQERKYFSGRYYRQHCTFRNGAYIKDLSSVEPDLSKVMILDNSPLSYIFHEGMAKLTTVLQQKALNSAHRQCITDRRLDQRSHR
jgi:CTD nuclear envelope phosphatase 1